MNHNAYKYIFLTASVFVALNFCGISKAADFTDPVSFNVEKTFDVSERLKVQAVLVKTTNNLYFYIEKPWWDSQVPAKKSEILADLDALSVEVESKIYPTLTSVFGSEWKPGVDGDNKITVLFQVMKEGSAGYFNSADEYLKLQIPDSNEREMIYLSLSNIESPQLKAFFAHEFVHLITFNQKDRMQGVQEEVWLNEARADYAPTLLGYDNAYEGSNLQRRVKDFLSNPSDPLTEWQERKYDYALVNLFMHYLVDHYSISVASTSLKSKLIGTASINETLARIGAKEDFSQVFTNWTITNVINACASNAPYCYINPNLKSLRINPTLNFLPLTGNSSLSVTNVIKNWSGSWQKVIGGNGDLTLQFSSLAGLNFQVPYVLFDKDNSSTVNFLKLDANQHGEITIKNFGEKYNSLVIIPSLQTKMSGFDSVELTYPYTLTVSIAGQVVQDDSAAGKAVSLKKPTVPTPSTSANQHISCGALNNNLYWGVVRGPEVTCLQEFLKLQGAKIYPEGYITGIFANLTKAAVVRFQTKYNIPATGFVGILTRTKINTLLNGSRNF